MGRRRRGSPPRRPWRTRAWWRGQAGFVGGVEVLPFGVLVFVVGGLLLGSAWAVVDAKLAVDAAAREAGRAYVESPDPGTAAARADDAARAALQGAGRDPKRLVLRRTGSGGLRCSVVVHRAAYRLPTISLPFVGGWGRGITVHGSHRDVVDPFASGLAGDGACA